MEGTAVVPSISYVHGTFLFGGLHGKSGRRYRSKKGFLSGELRAKGSGKDQMEMYEYKVETYIVKDAEKGMNELARDGWRVVAVSPNQAMGFGLVVTYERKIN